MAMHVSDLHEAIERFDTNRVESLISKGADVNEICKQETALTRAIYAPHDEISDKICSLILNSQGFNLHARNQFDCTAVHAAASTGRHVLLEKLLVLGADVNEPDFKGISPLSACAGEDTYACAKILIRSGANLNQRASDDRTPLHRACAAGATKLSRLLIEHGCLVNVTCRMGITPMMEAVSFYYHYNIGNKKLSDLLSVCEALVEAGCDLNVRNDRGKSALHMAVESNNLYGLCFLAENGCDVDVVNGEGLTPYQVATLSGSSKYEAARLLLCYGADAGKTSIDDLTIDVHGRIYPTRRIMAGVKNTYLSEVEMVNKALLLQLLCEASLPPHVDYSHVEDHTTDDYDNNRNNGATERRVYELPGDRTSSPSHILEATELAVREWERVSCHEPPSLQHLAKLEVRKALGAVNFQYKLRELPVGGVVKRYINLGVPLDHSMLYDTVLSQARLLSKEEGHILDKSKLKINMFTCIDGESVVSLCFEKGSDAIVSHILKYLTSEESVHECDWWSNSLTANGPYQIMSMARSDAISKNMSIEDQSSYEYDHNQCCAKIYSSPFTGDTILHHLAKSGWNEQHLKYVVQRVPALLDAPNFSNYTPLQEAWTRGLFITVEALLQLGASPELSGGISSLLHLASASGAAGVVQALLSKGHNALGRDHYGLIPLDLAMTAGRQYTERGISFPRMNESEFDSSLRVLYANLGRPLPELDRETTGHSVCASLLRAFSSKTDDTSIETEAEPGEDAQNEGTGWS